MHEKPNQLPPSSRIDPLGVYFTITDPDESSIRHARPNAISDTDSTTDSYCNIDTIADIHPDTFALYNTLVPHTDPRD